MHNHAQNASKKLHISPKLQLFAGPAKADRNPFTKPIEND